MANKRKRFTDTERLDWLLMVVGEEGFMPNQIMWGKSLCWKAWHGERYETSNCPRKAIDSAMLAEMKEG